MDIATVIGVVGTFALLIGCILAGHGGHGGDIRQFIDVIGLTIVVGGSILTVFTAMPLASVLSFWKVIMKSVIAGSHDHVHVLQNMTELATVARRDGILALETKVKDEQDPFLANGIRMIVDGTELDIVKRLMRLELDSMLARHKEAKLGLDAFGKYGPAYGMVGTLIGLVLMLGNLDDPDAIGPGMAVALLGTMYGCIVSSCLALPLGDKLTLYSRREEHSRLMVMEGIFAIQAGDNPRVVYQKLMTFLSPSERAKLNSTV